MKRVTMEILETMLHKNGMLDDPQEIQTPEDMVNTYSNVVKLTMEALGYLDEEIDAAIDLIQDTNFQGASSEQVIDDIVRIMENNILPYLCETCVQANP